VNFAWFTPWPPQASGIAGRSREMVAALARRGHAIDVFVDEQDGALSGIVGKAPDGPPQPGEIRIQSAHDFVWRSHLHQHDLAVYQIGNSRLHGFIWPYLFRWPGLTVLHDARLHHARAQALLRHRRTADYRAEFAWNHPEVSPDLAELAVRGFAGPYYYEWPMIRAVVTRARLTVCHSRGATTDLQTRFPARPIEYLAMGEGPEHYDVAGAAAAFRHEHAIDSSAVLFGVHGALTAEKRVPQILRAFAATRFALGNSRLLLAGRPDPGLELDRLLDQLELRAVTVVVQSLDDESFDAAIAASDVSLNLRWPTALETSGPWLRSLAMSRATVIFDSWHQSQIPTLDPRTWRRHAPAEISDAADAQAAAVAIDILDEEHSLRLAMQRLAADTVLRKRLGRSGRHYWESEHTPARMIEEFERAAATALNLPAPVVDGPAHLSPDPQAYERQLLEAFVVGSDMS
jgi:glycosyltransferase involved in cell wall biosynthesis